MKTSTLISYDVNGNIHTEEDVKVLAQIPKYYYKKGGFFLMNKTLPTFLLKQNYSGLNYRVLFALLEKIDFNNRIKTFRQNDLAEELQSQQSSISRALKKLIEDEIIEKKGHDYYFTEKFVKYAGEKNNTRGRSSETHEEVESKPERTRKKRGKEDREPLSKKIKRRKKENPE